MPAATSSTSTSSQPTLPRDARLIAVLLAAAGAQDAEQGVVRMLTEFAHRYTGDVLQDAIMYAEHARPSQGGQQVTPALEDIRLAVQARTEGAQVPKEFLLQLSTTVNSIPLPPLPEVYGIRLPPPAQRLTAPNFSLVPRSTPLPAAVGARAGTGTGTGTGIGELEASLGGVKGEGSEEGDREGGLFGSEGEDDEDDDEDEEMEDVTAGIGGSGNMFSRSNLGLGATNGNGNGIGLGGLGGTGLGDEDYD